MAKKESTSTTIHQQIISSDLVTYSTAFRLVDQGDFAVSASTRFDDLTLEELAAVTGPYLDAAIQTLITDPCHLAVANTAKHLDNSICASGVVIRPIHTLDAVIEGGLCSPNNRIFSAQQVGDYQAAPLYLPNYADTKKSKGLIAVPSAWLTTAATKPLQALLTLLRAASFARDDANHILQGTTDIFLFGVRQSVPAAYQSRLRANQLCAALLADIHTIDLIDSNLPLDIDDYHYSHVYKTHVVPGPPQSGLLYLKTPPNSF